MSIYLFLSSQDSPNVESNTNNNFVTYLSDPLDLGKGACYCSLKEIHFQNKNAGERLYIFCDIIDFSLVKNSFQPILRSTPTSHIYINSLKFKFKQNHISSVRIHIHAYREGRFVSADLDGVTELLIALDKQ